MLNITYRNIIDKYFYLLALVLPITSFLVIPSIKGTTPAFLLALGSIFVVLILSIFRESEYIKSWLMFSLVFIFIVFMSQLGLVFSDRIAFDNVRLVDVTDTGYIFRKSIITQSLYLIAAISTFFFVKKFYNEKWDKSIFTGVILLVGYGFYEFIYFLVFHQNGDFITNRVFGEGLDGSGSLFQLINVGSLTLMRMKSLTGEPSMFAFTVLPFWVYSIHKNKKILQIVLFAALLLSTSTTAFIGIAIYFMVRVRYYGILDKFTVFMGSLITVLLLMYWKQVNFIYQSMIIEKLTLRSSSGMDRFDSLSTSLKFFLELPIINMFFGVGFGTIRSTEMLSTLLVNTGIVGFILFSALFLYPVFKLRRNTVNIGLKASLLIIYITMMISVSEFSYLPTWLFLGLSYYQIRADQALFLLPNQNESV